MFKESLTYEPLDQKSITSSGCCDGGTMWNTSHLSSFWFVTKHIRCIAVQLCISILMWAPHRDGGDLLHPTAPEIQFTTWSRPGDKKNPWIHLFFEKKSVLRLFDTWRPGLLHVRFFIDASQGVACFVLKVVQLVWRSKLNNWAPTFFKIRLDFAAPSLQKITWTALTKQLSNTVLQQRSIFTDDLTRRDRRVATHNFCWTTADAIYESVSCDLWCICCENAIKCPQSTSKVTICCSAAPFLWHPFFLSFPSLRAPRDSRAACPASQNHVELAVCQISTQIVIQTIYFADTACQIIIHINSDCSKWRRKRERGSGSLGPNRRSVSRHPHIFSHGFCRCAPHVNTEITRGSGNWWPQNPPLWQSRSICQSAATLGDFTMTYHDLAGQMYTP